MSQLLSEFINVFLLTITLTVGNYYYMYYYYCCCNCVDSSHMPLHAPACNIMEDMAVMLSRTLCSRTRTWNLGQGRGLETIFKAKVKKLKVKTNLISKALSQRHVTINWGDFSKILHILNVISSIILLQ